MALPPGYADSVHEYPNHAVHLLKHLGELRKDSRLHDVVLKLADGEWRAHKCVLSAFSGFFHSLFMGSGSRDKEVKLKTVTCKGFGPLLEYMYTGKLELVEENVMEVFCTAGYLQVFNVLSDISKFLSNTTLSTQQKGNGNNFVFNLRNDSIGNEEMYSQGVCDMTSVQQDSRSQSPDSGNQSGEEFRTEEETMPLSGNSLDILAAQMTADAFAQVLSLDLNYNGLSSASVAETPVTIADANGVPSIVVLEQGKVNQVQEISVEGNNVSLDKETQNTDALEQLVSQTTQGIPEPSLEQTLDGLRSLVDCTDHSRDCMIPEDFEKVDSAEQTPTCTSGDADAVRTPTLDVGTAGDVDSFSSTPEEETSEKAQGEMCEGQDVAVSGDEIPVKLGNNMASFAVPEMKESQVEHQEELQVVSGTQSQLAQVDRDSSFTMQTGDVLGQPRTEDGQSTVTTDGKNETETELQTVLMQSGRPKRKITRKTNYTGAKRGRKSKSGPHLCPICGEQLQNDRQLQLHVAKDHGEQPQSEGVERDDSLAMQTGEELGEPGIQGCHSAVGSFEPMTRNNDNSSSAVLQTIQGKERKQKVAGKNNNTVTTKRRRKLKNDPYLCRICGEELQSSGKLRTHMANHEGGKKYECIICSAKFGYSNHLADHMRIHTGERPYKCGQCDAGFKQMSTLIRHTRRHTGQMPYRCAVCNLGFHDTTHLKHHMKTHLPKEKNTLEEEFKVTVIAECTTLDLSSIAQAPMESC